MKESGVITELFLKSKSVFCFWGQFKSGKIRYR